MIAEGLTAEQVDEALNKKSGLLGVSELSATTCATCWPPPSAATTRPGWPWSMFVYRIVKYIGSYYTILPRLDAVVLTGGIGENSLPIRRQIVPGPDAAWAPSPTKAATPPTVGGKAGPITADGSTLPVWVVPTNEELMIARDTAALVSVAK